MLDRLSEYVRIIHDLSRGWQLLATNTIENSLSQANVSRYLTFAIWRSIIINDLCIVSEEL